MSETSHAKPVPGRIDETLDTPLERLRLLAGDDDAMSYSPSSPARARSRGPSGSRPTTAGSSRRVPRLVALAFAA
jgi:hypothetical protein